MGIVYRSQLSTLSMKDMEWDLRTAPARWAVHKADSWAIIKRTRLARLSTCYGVRIPMTADWDI